MLLNWSTMAAIEKNMRLDCYDEAEDNKCT